MKPALKPNTIDLFAALGNPQRALVIQFCLSAKSVSLCDLTQAFPDIPRSSLTHHVNTLVAAGALTATKAGRETNLSVNRAQILKHVKYLTEMMGSP